MENIIFEKADGVATITLNRPKALNALNTALMTELRAAVQDANEDELIRVIVITGSGDKAFCAGADIPEIQTKSPIEARNWSIWLQSITKEIEASQTPVIARINGFCLGGGLELAMSCDFRIASDKSKFGQPEINLGLIPGAGGTQRLTRLVGRTKSMEINMLGQGALIDAAEAARLNLINCAVPEDELDAKVDEYINKIKKLSAVTIGLIKLTVNKGIEMDLDRGLYYEAEAFGSAVSTEDFKEGTSAFLEKRKPEFKNR
ncbi:crotonase [Methanosarcinales archaeon]|uniref:Enoyl-CoA hydratase n=1 Tax=Candidatus Syntropharchaeum caldarium TaxID=1838285 RepID=A0A1F2PAY5_9EURY|nr:MAG: enoyl-CoA hydratase [Candidatus Syntrophoarchaeum caldarius]RLG34468.1 MAG: crotonase [Methanosarcinales archaeon]